MNETTSPSRSQPEDPRLRAEFPAVYEPDFLSVLDSVQAEAIRRADAGAGEWLLIWAAEQTHGQGQHGPWDSPAGGLYCAVLLEPDFPADRWPEVGLVAALALGTAAAELLPPLTGLDYRWPNDILVNGYKVGGVNLTSHCGFLIVGAQLNIVPPVEGWEYASLVADGAAMTTPGEALTGYARHFIDFLQRWHDQGLAAVLKSLRARGLQDLDEQGGLTGETHQTLAAFFGELNP